MFRLKTAFGLTLTITLALSYLYLSIFKPGEIGEELGVADQIIVAGGVSSGFLLWAWMLSDFFRRRDVRYKVAWGWTLVLLNLLAAAAYFLVIYLPREQRNHLQKE